MINSRSILTLLSELRLRVMGVYRRKGIVLNKSGTCSGKCFGKPEWKHTCKYRPLKWGVQPTAIS